MTADPLRALVEFLLGRAPYDGVWFGDQHPTKKGAFWWRDELEAAMSQGEPTPPGMVLVDRSLVPQSAVDAGVRMLGQARKMAYNDEITAMMVFSEMVLLAAAPAAQVANQGSAVPISVGRQERQSTHPALPTFYQTRLNYGAADNSGNTVAFVFGNNSTDAKEQMEFAEKLVRAYNRDAAAPAVVVDEGYSADRIFHPGDRVIWQGSNGAEFPAKIVKVNHRVTTYDAKLDDGCDAKDFAAGRFRPALTAALGQGAGRG